MSERPVRVALFPDSLNEVNGVANTCRNWLAYVHRNQFPMLVVSGADKTEFRQEGTISRLDLKRGPISFSVEKDLRFDVALAVFRHHKRVADALREFRPEVVHITGPSDIGMMGAITAHKLGIPVAASWQTNIHEYAARRASLVLPRWLSGAPRAKLLQGIEDLSFRLAVLYYTVGRFHFAPNQELIDKLSAASGKPCSLMERGVDPAMFNPAHRTRGNDGQFVIGYVGRLSTEKKVRSFAGLAKAVKAAGYDHVKFVFVGHGAEEKWLSKNIPNVEMTGVLRGDPLSRAYANMDLFAFYSETDTFGNVVLEALASGVPAVVTDKGGPKFIVDHERCGFVCSTDEEFGASVLRLIASPSLQCDMAIAARQRAQRASWDSVFDSVYDAYRRHLPNAEEAVSAARFHGILDSAAPESLD
jgi:glycosyltransferase involved in cell wall biosynthesis